MPDSGFTRQQRTFKKPLLSHFFRPPATSCPRVHLKPCIKRDYLYVCQKTVSKAIIYMSICQKNPVSKAIVRNNKIVFKLLVIV